MSERTIRIRVGALIWRDGKVLLVRHERGGRSYWLVPGGGVDAGETMVSAAARELLEETGYQVEIGRLLLVCEAIDPKPSGRHVINAVYAGTVRAGTLAVGQDDRSLRDAMWHPLEALEALEMYPPIGAELLAVCRENGSGAVRVLGNTWRPYSG
ncbi:MAG TPA: NUDIX hydrolase [Candidatus Saccharimonadales bacterium]|nr:NUDIX hydrolase [Candidatus Saccharimonadales bacterium]